MVKNSQAASPVISTRISTGSGVFSEVRTQVDNRLNHRVSAPNRIPHLIAAGRASVPTASISNPLAASVAEYSPQPGDRLARQMHLDVQNTPASKVDNVADAIQRYLGIRPRREPTADPLDEASVARHPQQLNQSASRWAEARYYQFGANGLERYQFQPEYRAWGGGLEIDIAGEGQADISAPAHRSPISVAGGISEQTAADPDLVFAAQKTMSAIEEGRPQPADWLKVGPSPVTEDPAAFIQAAQRTLTAIEAGQPKEMDWVRLGPRLMTEDPRDAAQAAQRTLGRLRDMLEGAGEVDVAAYNRAISQEHSPVAAFGTALNLLDDMLDDTIDVSVGDDNRALNPANSPSYEHKTALGILNDRLDIKVKVDVGDRNMAVNPATSPVQAYSTAMDIMREALGEERATWAVGAFNMAQNPSYAPSEAFRTAVARAKEGVEKIGPPPVRVGAPNQSEDILASPDKAWITATVVGKGLEGENYRDEDRDGLARPYRPRSLDEAYLRAIRIMQELEVGVLKPLTGALDSRA